MKKRYMLIVFLQTMPWLNLRCSTTSWIFIGRRSLWKVNRLGASKASFHPDEGIEDIVLEDEGFNKSALEVQE